MLVLTRKFGERIHIGDGITVAVVSIRGNKVQLGIEAPQQVRVARSDAPPSSITLGPAFAGPEASRGCDP